MAMIEVPGISFDTICSYYLNKDGQEVKLAISLNSGLDTLRKGMNLSFLISTSSYFK